MLFDAGVVSREQVEKALEIQRAEGGKTFEILVRLGYLQKEDLHGVLSRQPGIASIDLGRFKVSPDLLALIPKELALKELVLPIDKLGRLLTVAMACPLDVETIRQIEQLTGLSVKAMLAGYDDIASAVEKYYPRNESQHDALPVFEMPGGFATHKPAAAATASQDLTEEITALALPCAAPGVGAKLLELVKASQPDLKAAMQCAAGDPVLSGWLLAVANSPAYGMPAQVESLGLAFALLGADGVAAATEHFIKDAPAPKGDITALLAQSQKAALAAAALAKKAGKPERSAAFTAGLLRNLGIYALASVSSDAAGVYATLPEEERRQQERERFGITHLEAGSIIASRWRFPQALHDAISSSASEAKPSPHLAVAVIATALAAQGAEALEAHQASLSALGIDRAAVVAETQKVLQ